MIIVEIKLLQLDLRFTRLRNGKMIQKMEQFAEA
jgi:hypothetical protein